MAVRTQHELSEDTWFITFTCYEWIPLFEITNSYEMVYKWLNLISEKYQIQTYAFVIMPNHLHLLLRLNDTTIDLNKVIGNAKRFMAYELVKRLEAGGQYSVLQRLASACSDKEKAKRQKHKVFEPSFDAKPVYTLAFLHQKLDYIHANPVSGKWSLCDEFTKYPHSSAAFYHDGVAHPYISIVNYTEFWG